MELNLDELIDPPGHFMVGCPSPYQRAGKQSGRHLDIFKERARAEKVYEVYARCHNNAVSLLEEAELLNEKGFHARAFALAVTAWEELGKSQIAADFYSGMLTDIEYEEAFKNHRFKTSYLNRMAVIDETRKLGVAYNPLLGERLENLRQRALYVTEDTDPKADFTFQNAKAIIDLVGEHIGSILHAEWLNGRIGSKGIFK